MFNQYPYTDGYELNTDWIISKIKNVETSEANARQSAEDADTARQGAVDAQGLAEAAQRAAEDAQTAAEEAQRLSENARDDAQGYAGDAAQTVQNTLDQITLLQSRVDNIIPDGTQTVGNTELLDIRVGVDSTIYDSAGNAVRGQITEVEALINERGAYSATANLFDSDDINEEYILDSDGTITANSGYNTTGFIPINGVQDVCFQVESAASTYNIYYCLYASKNENDPIGSRVTISLPSADLYATLQSTAATTYIRFSYRKTAYTDIMIHIGNTKVTYIEHYALKSNIASDADITAINNSLNNKPDFPHTLSAVAYTETRGIIKTDLTVYDTGEGYAGRYTSISVNAGDVYCVSCRSANSNYPGAFVTLSGGGTTTLLGGANTSHRNVYITIPADADTLYLNGNTEAQDIAIRKYEYVDQSEFDFRLSKQIKVLYKDGNLYVKHKHDASNDICLVLGNTGNNNLFNFKRQCYIANNDNVASDMFDKDSLVNNWTMNGSDWFGPYIVAAVNNINGDHPDTPTFTGGNHLISGSTTAAQLSLDILIDGCIPIQNDVIYSCDYVKIIWSNEIQAYNTVKDDGTGRNVMHETYIAKVDAQGVSFRNTIHATEDIELKRYFGAQATGSGMKFRYIGGSASRRAEYTIGTDDNNSGTNTCRSARVYDANYDLEIVINDEDLGSFDHNEGYSFFTGNGKMYACLVRGDANAITIPDGNEYYYSGSYIFN